MIFPSYIKQLGVNHSYPALLDMIFKTGHTVNPRDQKTLEISPLTLHIEDARRCVLTIPDRKLNYSFMVAECFWIMMGRDDVKMISHYNKNIGQFSDDGESFVGAYGPRIVDQLPYAMRTLRDDPSSRQAVILIWQRHLPKTKDVPCTLTMQFLAREGKLHAIVNMRSSDAWLGIPYDVFNFAMILAAIAGDLNYGVGSLTINIGSSHLYERHWDRARKLAYKYRHRVMKTEGLVDPRPPLITGWPVLIELAEREARQNGKIIYVIHPWREYIEALAYRTHRDPERGSGYFMRLIRRLQDDLKTDD